MRSPTLGTLVRSLLLGGLVIPQLALAAPARTPRPPTVYGTLQALHRSGQLSAEAYGEDSATYTAAQRLSGTRRAELASVIANTQQIAAAGELIPSRLPALMLTLERNTQLWSHEPLPGADQRVSRAA